MPPPAAHLDVPATTASLETVRRFVEGHARRAGFDEGEVMQVVLAVDEAATNIVRHAYHGEAGHAFTVAVRTTAQALTVLLRHEGEAFDPSRYPGPLPLGEATQQRRKGGLGVHLMQRLMDEVAYSSRGRRAEVRLSKHRR